MKEELVQLKKQVFLSQSKLQLEEHLKQKDREELQHIRLQNQLLLEQLNQKKINPLKS